MSVIFSLGESRKIKRPVLLSTAQLLQHLTATRHCGAQRSCRSSLARSSDWKDYVWRLEMVYAWMMLVCFNFRPHSLRWNLQILTWIQVSAKVGRK
jgi:hypothetical protein